MINGPDTIPSHDDMGKTEVVPINPDTVSSNDNFYRATCYVQTLNFYPNSIENV